MYVLLSSSLVIVFALFFVSCSGELKIDDSDDRVIATNLHTSVDSYNEHKWEIGLSKKALVTRDVSVTLSYPTVGADNLELIQKKYQVNSWLVRVRQNVESRGEKILGYTVLPFYSHDYDSLVFLNRENRATIRLAYDVSFPTSVTSKFPCPIYDHNKVVGQVKIFSNVGLQKEKIVLFPSYGGTIDDSLIVKRNNMVLPEFNAGSSLVGNYYFDFAFYDSKEKILYSDFIESETKIAVLQENVVSYSGCENYNFSQDRSDNIFRVLRID